MSKLKKYQKEIFKNIIHDNTGIEISEIKDNSHFINDLRCDSLDVVQLIMSCEQKFEITITDEDADKIKTVKDAYKLLSKLV